MESSEDPIIGDSCSGEPHETYGQRLRRNYARSFMSTSSNATMSSIAGAGRTLGKFLFRPGGKAVEKALGVIAQRAGFGPIAVADRMTRLIEEEAQRLRFHSDSAMKDRLQSDRRFTSSAAQLWSYVESTETQTQIQALQSLITLVTTYPTLLTFSSFARQNLSALFSAVERENYARGCTEDELEVIALWSQRTALCFENDALTNEMLNWADAATIEIASYMHNFYTIVRSVKKVLALCIDANYSFVAVRFARGVFASRFWLRMHYFSDSDLFDETLTELLRTIALLDNDDADHNDAHLPPDFDGVNQLVLAGMDWIMFVMQRRVKRLIPMLHDGLMTLVERTRLRDPGSLTQAVRHVRDAADPNSPFYCGELYINRAYINELEAEILLLLSST